MAPKASSKSEAGVLNINTLDEILEKLNSEEPSKHLEGLMRLLKGTEASKEVRYAMVEKEVVQAVRPKMDSEDPDVKLTAVRLIARYATFQGTMRKTACSTDSLLMLWSVLEQYQKELSAKLDYQRKKEEEEAKAEAAAAAEGGNAGGGKKDGKGKDKDKGAKKGKGAVEEAEGPVFNIPPATLLEAVLRGVSTIVLKDTKATNRITSMYDMQPLITLMDHPVPLIQDRARAVVSALMRSGEASTALYHVGLQDLLIKQLEVPEIPKRMYAVRILRKMAAVPDSRLQGLVSAGVVKVLTKMVLGIQPEGYAPPEVAKDAKGAKGKDKKGAEPVDPQDNQDPEVHKLQEAASDFLAYLAEYLPEAAESVSNVNGPDALRALLPEPVEEQLTKYGIPFPAKELDEPSAEASEEGEAEEEQEAPPEEVAPSPKALSAAEQKKQAMSLMKSKAEREAEQQEQLERERVEKEAAEEAERLRKEAEEDAAAFKEANTKEMPPLKPNAPKVHAGVLQVIRAVLRNPETRQRMSEHPWPQIFLHLLYHGDAPPPVEEEPEAEKGKKGKGKDDKKGAKDAKGGKGKDDKKGKGGKDSKPSTPEVEPDEGPKEYFDPPGPMYPPFEPKIRAASLECCAELLQDEAEVKNEAGVSHITQGEEMVWLGKLIDILKEKTDPADPLDITLATRLALALGDVGLNLPEDVILKSRYTHLVKEMAALAEKAGCLHLKEAVGRASLVLLSDEHYTARPEPPPASPAVTPPPDPLVTSKYLWDALGKPAMVDGFVVQNLPTQKAS